MRRFRSVYLMVLFASCYVAPPTTAAQSAEELFRNYVTAVGGEAAIRAVRTRVTIGELVAGSNRAPLEIYQADPDRFTRVLRNTQVKLSENGFDGTTGWSRNDDARRILNGPELEWIRGEYHIHRPVMLRSAYGAIALAGVDTVGGHPAFRVRATRRDGAVETLYFDRQSGLLAGWDMEMSGATVATRLEDYRVVDGVRLPFRVRRSRPGFTWTEQATEIRQNVPIDSARFRMPAGG